jgi:uncharacterized CHY-type Zn-finger protein
MTDKIRDTKTLVCPECDHHYTYEEWQQEENCPLCKFNDGWEILPREFNKEL